jgi:integrase
MATVRKRQWADVQGKTKTAWFVDYYDGQGKRRRETFVLKRAADTRRLEIENELKAGTHVPDADTITVGEAARQWLQRGQRLELERGSLRLYDQMVRLGIEPGLGKVRLSRLTQPAVESWRDGLLERFSLNRARRILSVLRSIIAHAQRRGLVGQNVADHVRIETRTRLREKLVVGRAIPRHEEVRRLLVAAKEQRGRLAWCYPMLLTAVYTGLRQAELRGLGWRDVDLTKGRITVRSRADQWGTLGPPKSAAGQRIVPLAPNLVAALREWKLACGSPEMVFPGPRRDSQQGISQSGTIRVFAALLRQLGVVDQAGKPKYVFHGLRHFYASVMISRGVNIKWLQATMGHETITLTLDFMGTCYTVRKTPRATCWLCNRRSLTTTISRLVARPRSEPPERSLGGSFCACRLPGS